MAKKKSSLPYDNTKPETPTPDDYGLASRGAGRIPQIRHTRPEVARHCARMILKHNMDAQAAVSKMLSTSYPDATEEQIIQLARTIQASPYVQREMTKLLEDIGFGDEALKKLIGLLWQEVLGGNDKRWAAAARLLAEITGAAKASSKGEKLPTLKLVGMEAGLSEMLGAAAPKDTDPDFVLGELPDPDLDMIEDESEEDHTSSAVEEHSDANE